MKAIVQDRYGGADVLRSEEIAEPVAGDGEVVVQVAAAGVDRGAYHAMRGLPYLVRLAGFGVRRPKARVPGTNFAGRVESVGSNVTGFQPGDEVFGNCKGAFAERAVAAADRIVRKPEHASFEEAAVLPYPGLVSLQALRDRAHVGPATSVLVVGASGAVGTVAVQIAKALGAEVTGVCGGSSMELVRGLGADHVIDYRESDFATGVDRYDVVLDVGGNTPLRRLRRALAPRGTLVIVGGENGGRFTGGFQRQVAAKLLSPFVRQKLDMLIASEGADGLTALAELVDAGSLKPVMGRCFALADAAEAVADLDSRRTRGRLALTP